jgi:hypothetical protein
MTPQELEDLYKKLDQMVVVLSEDPTVQGPAMLQKQISQIRAHLNDLGVYVQRISREKYQVARELAIKQTSFDAESDKKLAEDAVVKQLPSLADKKASINTALAVQLAEINTLKLQLSDLEFVDKTLKFRHQELQDTMSAVRLQRSLIESEGRTGAFYGSEGSGQGEATPREQQEEITFQKIMESLGKGDEDFGLDSSIGVGGDLEDLFDEGSLEPKPAPKLQRTPEGHINNCALACTGSEKGCQVCGGRCPDRDQIKEAMSEKGVAAKAAVPASDSGQFGHEASAQDVDDFLGISSLDLF